ncbi:MAG: hypothetical protein ABSG91_24120 [Syntrophobacteraceae bacterium]|jgi:maltooligosyltrehalose trehalohydrolase
MEELAAFGRMGDPPDPRAEETFQRSKLQHGLKLEGDHKVLMRFYRELLRVRKIFTASNSIKEVLSYEVEKVLLIRFGGEGPGVVGLLHFNRTAGNITLPWPPGAWLKELDSAEKRRGGHGSRVPPVIGGSEEVSLSLAPHSFAFFLDRNNI